jgi:creatinine amidohydrolase
MQPTIRHHLLAETNWETVKKSSYDIAILPWGATEAHNYHLPYATDNYQVEYVAEQAASIAWSQGVKTIVLPAIPFGVNTGQLDIPLCINLMPSTQAAILNDVCDVLQRHNIGKLIILNGHGGNNFISIIRELNPRFPDLFICAVNWYQAAGKDGIFEKPGDHADEMETSVMMQIAPHLVLPLDHAGDGSEKKYSLKGFQEKWAWAPRPWTKISKDTGTGDPSLSSAAKGARFLEATIKNFAEFIADLGKNKTDDLLK